MQDRVFHILTFGCQMNVNDSGWLARMLAARGFREGGLEEASLVVVNTCSVREKPELKVKSALGRIRQETAGREVLVCVCGCVAQQLGEKLFGYSPQVRLVAGTDGIAGIPQALEDLLDHPGRRLCLTGFTARYEERPDALGDRVPASCFVNIMQGCDNFCTYCIVPYTRGRQKSRAHGAVLGECRELVARGASEITLLGQNVNAYGKDRTGDGTSFAALLRQTAAISGLRRLRYVTPHPKDMTGEDVALFGELASLCPRLHLPVQAGSDRVLKRMNRRYTSADFLALVSRLR
ncbi:MAG: MiaB/RimO family radical SAM methylthiotransferase, partial [Desulfovibrio sp.]|nr:MiaB/RimO family radical SAM methylthiotransferase [Desulfovibrio sp.]